MRCKGGCQGLARYCSAAHQKAHWERHKFFCKRAGKYADQLASIDPATLLKSVNNAYGAEPIPAESTDELISVAYSGKYPPALERAFAFVMEGKQSLATRFSEEYYWCLLVEKKPFRWFG